MNYNELSKEAYGIAREQGFHDEALSSEHFLALIFSEVGEAIDAHRLNKGAAPLQVSKEDPAFSKRYEYVVKGSIEEEFADIMIRLFDLSGVLMIDFDRMQPCRYYRAFERFSFTENAFAFIKGLSKETICVEKRIMFGLEYMENWSRQMGIDLDLHVAMKMHYNRLRTYKHQKAY